MPKNVGEIFKTLSLRSNSVTRQVTSIEKLVENAKIEKFKCDIFDDFQTLCGFLNSSSAAWKFELCSKAEREREKANNFQLSSLMQTALPSINLTLDQSYFRINIWPLFAVSKALDWVA